MSARATACSNWSSEARSWPIDWEPASLSRPRSLCTGRGHARTRGAAPGRPCQDDAHRRADWPDDLCEIVYFDHFGNTMTGVRAAMLPSDGRLAVAGRVLERANTSLRSLFTGIVSSAVCTCRCLQPNPRQLQL
jgi:hypothetical protein